MDNQERPAQIDALNKLARQLNDLEITDDNCAVISLVVVNGRVYPSVMGSVALLIGALKLASLNSDDFKGLLFATVNELGGTERQQELEAELDCAASNFNRIAEVAGRLTSGNVMHDGSVILNMARRCELSIQKVIKQE